MLLEKRLKLDRAMVSDQSPRAFGAQHEDRVDAGHGVARARCR